MVPSATIVYLASIFCRLSGWEKVRRIFFFLPFHMIQLLSWKTWSKLQATYKCNSCPFLLGCTGVEVTCGMLERTIQKIRHMAYNMCMEFM